MSRFPLSHEQNILPKQKNPAPRYANDETNPVSVSISPINDSASTQKAFEQIPKLTRAASTILHDYSDVIKEGLELNATAVSAYYNSSKAQIEVLLRRLESADASNEERKLIIEALRNLRERDAQMVEQNQQFIDKTHMIMGTAVVVCVSIIASLLGAHVSVQLTKSKT